MDEYRYSALWILLINMIFCCVLCESISTSRKSLQPFRKSLKLLDQTEALISEKNCENLPSNELTDVLGPAFNSRYMSIAAPKYLNDDTENDLADTHSNKRNTGSFQSFQVDDTFAMDISDRPAWEVKHVSYEHDSYEDDYENEGIPKRNTSRLRRFVDRVGRNSKTKNAWECESQIRWIDLGLDYFPRFLRTVECTNKKCWYGHYSCKPRSFTVKILRRRVGECVSKNESHRIVSEDLPSSLKEKWVWEERAVNFCCDCVSF